MRIVGLITEYNPFHNGHLYHLQESLRLADADASVAVMSGHFLQRGEPALVDKWVRSEMALAAGVDLVLELPFPFACNSAPYFAQGAIQTLNGLGVVDALCFGSETGKIEPLQTVSRLLVEQSATITSATQKLLRTGVSYPVARAEVLAEMEPSLSKEMLASPNNILGIEYLKALQTTTSEIQPCTLKRIGAAYHSTDIVGPIASATGIRKLIGEKSGVDDLIPSSCCEILKSALAGERSLNYDRVFDALQAFLLQEMESLSEIYQVEEGLGQRLVDASMTATSYPDLVDAIKSRQWTQTRIQRILSYVLLQITRSEMASYLDCGPLYLRVLGATEQGRKILAKARKKRSLPMISDPARGQAALRRFYGGQTDLCRLAEQMLACDLRATRLYGLMQKSPEKGHRNQDFFRECLT